MKTIYLAGGCFWGVEHYFSLTKGIMETEVGYANGTLDNPKYEDLKHGLDTASETVKIIYDENIISLEKILELYLRVVDPYSVNKQGEDEGLQYRTGIYYLDENDKFAIVNYFTKVLNPNYAIEVTRLNKFFKAEEYHQDYLNKNPQGYCHINMAKLLPEERKQLHITRQSFLVNDFFVDNKSNTKEEYTMKSTKIAIFSLSMVALLAACQKVPEKKFFINLINPENVSMLTDNCKAYVDAMREQQQKLKDEGNDIYKYHDLYAKSGVNIDEGSKKDDERKYLDTGDVNGKNATVRNATPDRSDKSMGIELKFEVEEGHEKEEYKVLLSDNEQFEGAKEYVTNENSVSVNNLFVNKQYYWKVVADGEESKAATFTTGDYPRWISARPVFNVRDLGGYMTQSGKRVKQGLVYRGGEITNKTWGEHALTNTEESKAIFNDLMNIGVELDLRGATDIGDGYKDYAFRPGENRYKQHAIKSYEETFTKTRSEVAAIFDILANADNEHVYFHCYGGADRTGTIGFLLNGLLGVSYTDLVIDFELTSYSSINNEHIRSHIDGQQHQYDRWPKLINQLKTDTTGGYEWNENKLLKDNIKEFLLKACSVSSDSIAKIERIMLED